MASLRGHFHRGAPFLPLLAAALAAPACSLIFAEHDLTGGSVAADAEPTPSLDAPDAEVDGEEAAIDAAPDASADADALSTPRRRRLLTVTNDVSLLPTTLDDFPVFVPLGTITTARADRRDVRFVDADGKTPLVAELASGGAWVRLPHASPGGTFYATYGDPTVMSDVVVPKVWEGRYAHVFHLDDPKLQLDSVTGAYASPGATAPASAPGVVGAGLRFEPTTVPEYVVGAGVTKAVTYSMAAWIQVDPKISAGSTIGIVQFTDAVLGVDSSALPATLFMRPYQWSDSTWSDFDVKGVEKIAPGVWRHVAVVANGKSVALYLDGGANGTRTFSSASASTVKDASGNEYIGWSYGGARFFYGNVDEVRLVNDIAWSTPWILAEWASQAKADTFVTIGVEETY